MKHTGFTKVPNDVLLRSSLSLGARMTYALLKHRARNDSHCWPSQKTLAGELGVKDTRQVRRWLEELAAPTVGLISIERRGKKLENVYHLLPLSDRTQDAHHVTGQTEPSDRTFSTQVTGHRSPLP
jgi:hypothetical protein